MDRHPQLFFGCIALYNRYSGSYRACMVLYLCLKMNLIRIHVAAGNCFQPDSAVNSRSAVPSVRVGIGIIHLHSQQIIPFLY